MPKLGRKAPNNKKATDEWNAKRTTSIIRSIHYIIKHTPKPVFQYRQANARDHVFPPEIGLTKGRTMTVDERIHFTMEWLITPSEIPHQTNTVGVWSFLKCILKYMPQDLKLKPHCPNRETCTEATLKAYDELYEWFEDYKRSVELELAMFYMNTGEKNGSHWLKVLERRFKNRWSVTPERNIKLSASVSDNKSEEKDDKTIVFQFETVTCDNPSSST